MKILLTTIILIFWINFIQGQSFDSIATHHYGNGKEILNQTDSLGRKQGLWVYYKMFFDTKCSALSTLNSYTCFKQLSKGYYKDDKKTGKWEYYTDGGCYFSINRIEFYSNDGSVKEIKYEESTTTLYSSDSSLVTSTVIFNTDTFQII